MAKYLIEITETLVCTYILQRKNKKKRGKVMSEIINITATIILSFIGFGVIDSVMENGKEKIKNGK